MAKILKCNEEKIVIGLDDGSLKEVRKADLNFEPQINDEVEIFENETEVFVSKKENTNVTNQTNTNPNANGVNINISNVNNPVPQTIYQSGKVTNKVAYLILCFFLGSIGVHKFVVGKVGTGILYLIFAFTGIPFILSIIEFIVCCFKKADANGNIVV